LGGLIALLLWVVVGAVEGNWLIPLVVFSLLSLAILVLCIARLWSDVSCFICVGFLVRSIIAILAWYQAAGTEFSFWTGLNEDSNRFFLNSYLPIEESVMTTEDAGFPFINSVITAVGLSVGQDHYLLNVQVPLFCGTFFALAVFLWGRLVAGGKAAQIAAWITALHPTVVGWSTGLMRDTVISFFGWLLVFSLYRLFSSPRRFTLFTWFVLAVSLIVSWFIRNMTTAYLLVVCFIQMMLGSCGRLSRSLRVASISLLLVCLLAALFSTTDVLVRFDKSWSYGVRGRESPGLDEESVNDGGISARIAASGSFSVYLAVAPYAFIAPFPIYNSPHGFRGEPGRLVDYLFNIGGGVNLVLFILTIPAFLLWLYRARWDMAVLAGPMFYVVCILCVMAMGQSRWIMPFLYPISFISVASMLLRLAGSRRVLSRVAALVVLTVLAVYILYWMVKGGLPVTIAVPVGGCLIGVSICGLLLVVFRANACVAKRDVEYFSPRS
jgi:hypothetical protein